MGKSLWVPPAGAAPLPHRGGVTWKGKHLMTPNQDAFNDPGHVTYSQQQPGLQEKAASKLSTTLDIKKEPSTKEGKPRDITKPSACRLAV